MKNSLSKILITGANGQLGMALRHHPRAASYHLIPCSHADLDITDPASIQRAITTFSPDMVMNCAAYTAVDKAEQDLKQALNVNYIGAQNLAIACDTNEIPLIHVSTDYVFDGTHTIPYQEHDLACPINVYGDTKWRGEQVIREACKQHIVLRVSGVFSEYGNNFLKTILRLAQEKKNYASSPIKSPVLLTRVILPMSFLLSRNTHRDLERIITAIQRLFLGTNLQLPSFK